MQQQNTHSQWLEQTNSVEDLAAAATGLFRKIDTLSQTDRDRVYGILRNDSQVKSSIQNFQNQPA